MIKKINVSSVLLVLLIHGTVLGNIYMYQITRELQHPHSPLHKSVQGYFDLKKIELELKKIEVECQILSAEMPADDRDRLLQKLNKIDVKEILL